MKKNDTFDARREILIRVYMATNKRVFVYRRLKENLKLLCEEQEKYKYTKNARNSLAEFKSRIENNFVPESLIWNLSQTLVVYKRRIFALTTERKILKMQFKNLQRIESKALLHLQKWDKKMSKQGGK